MANKQINTTLVQLIKYGIIGASNTLLTFIVIFICDHLLSIDLMIANIIGYIVGVINSFIWNKQWVFRSHDKKVRNEIFLFLIGFGISFALQFATLWLLRDPMKAYGFDFFGMPADKVGEYMAVIIGMVVYTLTNYIFNRCITFRSK